MNEPNEDTPRLRRKSKSGDRKSKSRGAEKEKGDSEKKAEGEDRGKKSKADDKKTKGEERKSKTAGVKKETGDDDKAGGAEDDVKKSKSVARKSKSVVAEKETDEKIDESSAPAEPSTKDPDSAATKDPDSGKKKKGGKKKKDESSGEGEEGTSNAEGGEEAATKDPDSGKKKKGGKKKKDESSGEGEGEKVESPNESDDEKPTQSPAGKKKSKKKKGGGNEEDETMETVKTTDDENDGAGKHESPPGKKGKKKKNKKPLEPLRDTDEDDEDTRPVLNIMRDSFAYVTDTPSDEELHEDADTHEAQPTEKPIIWTSKEMERESLLVAEKHKKRKEASQVEGTEDSSHVPDGKVEDAEKGEISTESVEGDTALTGDVQPLISEDMRRSSQLLYTALQEHKKSEQTWGSTKFSVTDPLRVSYDNMQRVKIKVTFSRISDIDTIGQQFAAEIFVQARWVEPRLKGKTEKELDEIPFADCWDPRLIILNLVGGMEKDKLSIMVRYEEEEKHPVITYMWNVKAVFMETLELEHFPFDTQELSVVISSERPMDEIDILPDNQSISNVNANAIRDAQEWKSFRHVDFTQDFRSSDFYNSTMHPVLIASGHVRRRLGFYIWNIFIIVFLIIGLSLTILSIDPTGNDRLGVTMTLFLTCVAFKLVVKTTLPHISYLTYLDIYVVFTMMYLAAQAAENAIISHLARFKNRERVIMYDEIAQSILIGLLILFHAIFLVYIRLTAFSRRRMMAEKDHAYHLKVMERKSDSKKKSLKPQETTIENEFRFTLNKDKSAEIVDIFEINRIESLMNTKKLKLIDSITGQDSKSIDEDPTLEGLKKSRENIKLSQGSAQLLNETPLAGQGEGQMDSTKSTTSLKQPDGPPESGQRRSVAIQENS